jgi:ferredoxin/flavodoxin---NADP+ reductase
MSIKDSGHHFIAVFGGAVAGAEAAYQLSRRGFRVVVFDQGLLPYGKIEDGLPKWHAKLRNKEEQNIDIKLDQPNIMFVPGVKLGRDVQFAEVLDWGFSAVILATGAWRDRPLPIEGIDKYVGKGLVYQNPFVYWFNHKHEPAYKGPQFEIQDGAIVIGGGLASLDVVKILMLESVEKALKDRGIQTDMFTLEHGISKKLEQHGLSFEDLGIEGCTLYYRRRAIDMPLSPIATDTPENLMKAQVVRQKILDNYQKKYLFRFEECCIPADSMEENGNLAGIRFQRTRIENERVVPLDEYFEARSGMIISSIGSIPEMIPGVPSNGGIFKITDPGSCCIDGYENVFAIGNAVTGKGNINEAAKHGREISTEIMENYLAWHQEDYEKWHRHTAVRVNQDISKIAETIEKMQFLTDEVIQTIMENCEKLQSASGYSGNYKTWIQQNTPPRLENML